MSQIVLHIDHLVYATPDLDATIRDLEQQLGVRASPGGRHLGRGTRNALITIGERAYLEIIAPDPDQPPPNGPRWFNVDAMDRPRLVTWAAAATELSRLASSGVALGAVGQGSRLRQDGVALSWQLTDPTVMLGDGVVPFFIDWGMSPHPSATAVHGPPLVSLRAEHPDDSEIRRMLAALDLPLDVVPARDAALVAQFKIDDSFVELR